MFDGILGVIEIGSRFDVGTPIAGAVGDLIHGAGVVLWIPLDCGYDAQEIRGLLKAAGIESWAPQAAGEDLALRVARTDADRAVRVLARAGIPV